jgi:tRNA threonylcarbamoyladenosine biosynthesis protein TsaE
MTAKLQIISKSPEETRSLGKILGEWLAPGDVICLYGKLGAGKTCLTQGIAQGLGISQDEYVRSSSFVLCNEYTGGRIPLFHFDFYRMSSPEEALDIGFEEYASKEGVIVIEWADKFEEILPEERVDIHFRIDDLYTRRLLITIHYIKKREKQLILSLKKPFSS